MHMNMHKYPVRSTPVSTRYLPTSDSSRDGIDFVCMHSHMHTHIPVHVHTRKCMANGSRCLPLYVQLYTITGTSTGMDRICICTIFHSLGIGSLRLSYNLLVPGYRRNHPIILNCMCVEIYTQFHHHLYWPLVRIHHHLYLDSTWHLYHVLADLERSGI